MREFVRHCNVYCRPETDQTIIAAVYNHGGLYVEKPEAAVVVQFSDGKALHDAIKMALEVCEFQEQFDYSHHKKSHWPAYQASKCKTMKQFEAEFVRLSISGANSSNLFYDVESPEFGEFSLQLRVTLNAFSDDYGEGVQYLVAKYLACKAAI